MKTAFSYKRVSSQEQKEKKNSIPEQDRRIKEFAKASDIVITREFEDGNSAFHDKNRDDFDRMVKLALIERPNYIILDDSSRFARTRKVAINTKETLRSHGIEILYASEQNIDTNTVAGFWVEGIQEIKNEATSREISYHTKKGMSGNILQRDTETGWCYKNGGKAPYGYKRVILNKGFNQKGKPVYKTIWDLDENTYLIAKKIIVEMYTENEMSYEKIRNFLNSNNIPSPSGGLWSISTIMSMLREDRLEEYTGTAIWNKENKKVKGVKYNERAQWVICENAHPAIISKEELQQALKRKSKTSNSEYKPKELSDYLLSGLNIEGKNLFICNECGGHIIGFSSGNKRVKKYACSTNNHKGACACSNNWKIDKEWIESNVIKIIEKNYFTGNKMETNIDKIYKEVSNINNVYMNEIKSIEKEIQKVNKEIQNLLNSIKSGINPELVVEEINLLKTSQDNLKTKKTNILSAMDNEPKIKRQDVEEYFHNFKKLLVSCNSNEKKELIKTFISNITLNKNKHQIEITPYLIGVRSFGAGNGNRTRNLTLARLCFTTKLYLQKYCLIIITKIIRNVKT